MKSVLLWLRLIFIEPVLAFIGLLIHILQVILVFSYICEEPEISWRLRFLRRFSWINKRVQELSTEILALVKSGNHGTPHSDNTLQMAYADSDVVSQFLIQVVIFRLLDRKYIHRVHDSKLGLVLRGDIV